MKVDCYASREGTSRRTIWEEDDHNKEGEQRA